MKTESIILILVFFIGIILLIFGIIRDSKKQRQPFSIETENFKIEYIYADLGSRVLAHIIDVLIIIIPNSIIPVIPGWLYWSLQESGKKRTTVGKKTQQLYVMTHDGKRISFGKATGRFLLWLLTITFTLGFGFFFMFFNEKRQCLHDLATKTVVVKEVNRIKKQ